MPSPAQKLTRIGVFYDGNYFHQVSNYYHYVHPRKARISIKGLHEFLRQRVAAEEGVDAKFCQIIDAHYFRGRLRAQAAEQRDVLLKERLFDDILMREGVTTHYLPLGANGEKGIDVWLALEAYELAIYKRFDVIVLITCDGDFVPLVRKLNTIGTRVMLLGWDFLYTDQNDRERETRTSQALLEEATYPVLMHQVLDDRSHRNDPLINGVFMPKSEFNVRAAIAAAPSEPAAVPAPSPAEAVPAGEAASGRIQNLKDGFGFITPASGGANLFFFHTSVLNADFTELKLGDAVTYETGQNDKGECAVNVRVLG